MGVSSPPGIKGAVTLGNNVFVAASFIFISGDIYYTRQPLVQLFLKRGNRKITQTAVINIVFQRIFYVELDVSYASQHTFSKASIGNVKFCIKMRWNTMFITAVCVIFPNQASMAY